MLKILSFICVVTCAPLAGAAAFTLNCASPVGFVSHSRSVEVIAKAEYEPLSFGHARLSYRLDYAVDCVGTCWAQGTGEETGILADRSYRPTRYRDFFRFPLAASGEKRSLILPQVVQETATQIDAYLQLDGVQKLYGTTVPLSCKVVSVQSPAAAETSGEALKQADHIIQNDFGFPSLQLKANGKLLQQAMKNGSVTLATATRLAMAEILDDFEAFEAPLNIAANGDAETLEQKDKARRILRQELMQAGTTLSLYLGKTVRGENYPPEMGENAEANWIFVLRIPSLSDHIYWVVVDKMGDKAPYLYGFN